MVFAAGQKSRTKVSPLTPLTFSRLAEKVVPAVVGIEVRLTTETANGPASEETPALGSGFIITPQGHILTNSHVVERAAVVHVRLNDGRRLPARVLGFDPPTDIALLKVDASGPLPAAPLGDSDALRRGELVLAIGSPFGLRQTVTFGIVSAVGRRREEIRVREGENHGHFDFIQTDAAISRGNSGGPLVNAWGQVVGVNTAMLGSPSAQAPGIGFAVPINLAKRVLPLLEAYGRVRRSWIGLTIQPLTPELGKAFRAPDTNGALVSRVVPASPAASAGIEPGDILVSFDGHPIRRPDDLRWFASVAEEGRRVEVVLRRLGRRVVTSLVPFRHPDDEGMRRPLSREEHPATAQKTAFGIEVEELSAHAARRLGLCPVEGVFVMRHEAEAPAIEAGIMRHDQILRIGDEPVRTVRDYARVLSSVRRGEMIRMLVARYPNTQAGCDEQARYLWIAFPRR